MTVLTATASTSPPSEAVARTLVYRPHLDGLRALAVGMVFVFHASPRALSGGFIGVDVFFVLSGYLIRHLRRTPRTKNHALRTLRTPTAAAACDRRAALRHLFLRGDLGLRARAPGAGARVRATVLYVANWNLIEQSDEYFAESAAASPLRHMWSLAVEEQFYIVWPVVVLLIVRLRGRRGLAKVCLVLAVASAAAFLLIYSPTQVSRPYYGTDARVFQPLVGAALAIAVAGGRKRQRCGCGQPFARDGRRRRRGGSRTPRARSCHDDGSGQMYFRGGAIAVAVVTAVLIWALDMGAAPRARRLLSARPIVAVGLIHVIYLWHWPIILWLSPSDESELDGPTSDEPHPTHGDTSRRGRQLLPRRANGADDTSPRLAGDPSSGRPSP